MIAPLSDQVLGDDSPVAVDIRTTNDFPKEISIHAEYIGGNPQLARVREVTVTVPVLGVNDDIGDYNTVIETVFKELTHLAALSSYEDVLRATRSTEAAG